MSDQALRRIPTIATLAPGRPLAGLATSPKGRMLADGAWLLFAQASSAVATLIGVRLLTEVLAPEVYGTVNLTLGVLILGRNLFCYPFFQAALRFYPEIARRGELGMLRRILLDYLVRSTALLSALIFVAGVLACLQGGLPLALVPLAIALLVVDVFRTFETDLLNAARRQAPFALLRAAEAWARPIAAVLAVRYVAASPEVVLAGYLAGSGLAFASLYVLKVERVGAGGESAPLGPDAARLKGQVWRFGLPLIPLAVLEWTSTLSDRYLIGSLRGLEAAGIYAAGYGLVSLPFLMTQGVIEMIVRPIYFEAVAAGDARRVRGVFLAWVGATAAACLAGVVAIAALRPAIAAVCLAPAYRESTAALLPWIALGNALYAVSMVVEKVAHARKRTEGVLLCRAVGAVSSVAVGIPMILRYGVLGAAWAAPIYFGIQLAASVCVARVLGAGPLAVDDHDHTGEA